MHNYAIGGVPMVKINGYMYHEVDEYRDCEWVQDGKEECLGHLFYTDEDAVKEIEAEAINNTCTGRC